MSSIHIAVLLTVYNRKKQTLRCLSDLYKQTLPDNTNFEVFLTDDGCTDGTAETIHKEFPNVHIIQGNGTLFWNRGMWTAWNAASKVREFEYYLWLNDDTLTYPTMIKELLNVSKDKDDKAIIVGPTIDTHGKGVHTYGGRKGMVLVPLNEGVQECDTFNGNIALIPLSVYKILGTNDPYFHHSMGDLDYGMRSRKEGLKIYQLGSAVGECDRHERIMKWCDSEVSLPVRWRALHKATGYPPKEVFYFYQRHYGFCKAVFHVITTYTRCFFPSLWVKMNRANWI